MSPFLFGCQFMLVDLLNYSYKIKVEVCDILLQYLILGVWGGVENEKRTKNQNH